MHVLRPAKESAVKARTQAMNQVKAILLVLDPDLREPITGLTNPAPIATCAALGDDRGEAAFALRLLARRRGDVLVRHHSAPLTFAAATAARTWMPLAAY
ncbi:hypothetical protein ABZ622_36705 [Streptomyces sp. NPDC007164]|uniref:hypothetical protein n=1 Tax=Streptomyces sp. NPDC007164 TaxID=3156918 RepID=UPI003406413F